MLASFYFMSTSKFAIRPNHIPTVGIQFQCYTIIHRATTTIINGQRMRKYEYKYVPFWSKQLINKDKVRNNSVLDHSIYRTPTSYRIPGWRRRRIPVRGWGALHPACACGQSWWCSRTPSPGKNIDNYIVSKHWIPRLRQTTEVTGYTSVSIVSHKRLQHHWLVIARR